MINKILVPVLIFLILEIPSQCRNIEVPKIDSHTEHDMKLGTLDYLIEPKFEFKNVYSRGVATISDKKTKQFLPCSEIGPEVQFSIKDTIKFEGVPTKSAILYKFEDIKYSQFLLDVFYFEDQKQSQKATLYLIFQNGLMAYIRFSDISHIDLVKVFRIEDLEANQRLEVGYFVKIGQQVIFVNQKYVIKVSQYGGQVIYGYIAENGFESAVQIRDKYLAVANRESGVKIYKYEQNHLTLAYQIKSQEFKVKNSLQISDMAYYPARNTLIILDEDNGVLSFQLTINQDQITSSKFSLLLGKNFCTIMHLNLQKDSIHMICDKVYVISLKQYPKITQKILPHPKIKVREIFQIGPLDAYIGRDIFKLMYLDREVNNYEDRKLDRIVITKEIFLSASQTGLIIGKYKITPPLISCLTQDKQYLGEHKLVLTTKAECNEEYFIKNKISYDFLGNFTNNDTCTYTIYKNLYIWQPGTVYMTPIYIISGIFSLVAIFILTIWIIKKIKLATMTRQLDEYVRLGSNAEYPSEVKKGKYDKYEDEIQIEPENNMSSEKQENQKNKSQASNIDQEQDQDPQKRQISDVDPNVYDIQ